MSLHLKISETLTCPVCLGLVVLPVTLNTRRTHGITACSHVFCLKCIREYAGLNKPFHAREPISCPTCKSSVNLGRICRNANDCYQHNHTLWEILDDLNQVDDSTFECTNDCGENFGQQADFYHHLRETCPKATVHCDQCNVRMLRTDLESHNRLNH